MAHDFAFCNLELTLWVMDTRGSQRGGGGGVLGPCELRAVTFVVSRGLSWSGLEQKQPVKLGTLFSWPSQCDDSGPVGPCRSPRLGSVRVSGCPAVQEGLLGLIKLPCRVFIKMWMSWLLKLLQTERTSPVSRLPPLKSTIVCAQVPL